MIQRLLVISAGVALFAGCATASQSQWTPTVDTYGNSRAQYLTRDTQECRSLAMSASGTTGEAATQGAVSGGLLGAAGGAAIGGILGGNRQGVRRGAAVGAVGGAMSGGVGSAAQSDAQFQRAFNNCLRGRGHNVLS